MSGSDGASAVWTETWSLRKLRSDERAQARQRRAREEGRRRSSGGAERTIQLGPPRLGGVTLVAIDGPSGSGKSTLADELAADLDAMIIRTDDFATWDDPVAWWPRLRDGVLVPLAQGRAGRYTKTEWTDGVPHPGAEITVNPPKVLLLEGVSAGRRSVRPLLSALVWREVSDPALRLARAVARDGESSRAPLMSWQRFETGWYSVDGTKAAADHTA